MMLSELAIGLFLIAFILAFSGDISKFLKKMMAFPYVKLLLPLFLASLIIAIYQQWLAYGLVYINLGFLFALLGLTKLLYYPSITAILLLWLLALIPLYLLSFYNKRRLYRSQTYDWLIVLLIWLASVLIYLTTLNTITTMSIVGSIPYGRGSVAEITAIVTEPRS